LAVGRKEERKKSRRKERKKERQTDGRTDRQKESKTQHELRKHVVRNIPIYCRELMFVRYHIYYIFHTA